MSSWSWLSTCPLESLGLPHGPGSWGRCWADAWPSAVHHRGVRGAHYRGGWGAALVWGIGIITAQKLPFPAGYLELGETEAFLAFASPCPGPLPSLDPREPAPLGGVPTLTRAGLTPGTLNLKSGNARRQAALLLDQSTASHATPSTSQSRACDVRFLFRAQ